MSSLPGWKPRHRSIRVVEPGQLPERQLYSVQKEHTYFRESGVGNARNEMKRNETEEDHEEAALFCLLPIPHPAIFQSLFFSGSWSTLL
jgi:hypothetical protein